MIRINLAPRKKRGSTIAMTAVSSGKGASGAVILMLIVIGWLGLGFAGWWLLGLEQQAEQKLRDEYNVVKKKVDDLKKDVNEEELERREEEVKQVEAAIEQLKKRRKTPVYVMYELSMILTDAKEGGGPDIDQEKYRRNLRNDPQSRINDNWDPSGLWITKITETGDRLDIEGRARDATDLTEFTRRLRASARFGDLNNPKYDRGSKDGTLGWSLSVEVRRWD